MSENLRTARRSTATRWTPATTEAVFEFWSHDFHSHVTERVSPERVGKDIRGEEQQWWDQVRCGVPRHDVHRDLLIEQDDLIVSNWTVKGTHTGDRVLRRRASGEPVEINGTAILRMRDGQIVEHWGGPHCQEGLGLIR